MDCRGCGENKKFIKAHIIPESFFAGLKKDGESALMDADTLRYTKRSPAGVYDKGILCHDCEQKFQEIDHYGQKVLLKDPLEGIKRNGEIICYKITSVRLSKM